MKHSNKRRAVVDDRRRSARAIAIGLFVLTGCAVTGQQTPATAQEIDGSAMSAAEVRRGSLLFLQCRACHALDSADGHRVGPNLSGLFGSVAGKKDGFVYSDAVAGSELVWSEAALNEFLARPDDYFPGTKMVFAGMPNEQDRRQLIAYIKSELAD